MTTSTATPAPGSPQLTQDDLAGRLAAHVVSAAVVRKSGTDPVPFPVWWRVTDALRASVLGSPAEAAAEVDGAITTLLLAVGAVPAPRAGGSVGLHRADPDRELRLAQLLVARLVFTGSPTPPTLLHVRLARLRRALDAMPRP
jgi:hypothetical protein